MYAISRLNDDGRWQCLMPFDTYTEADLAFDDWCEMYPNAYLEIIGGDTDDD